MARRFTLPNPENASKAALVEAGRVGGADTNHRCVAIILLIEGFEPAKVCGALLIAQRTLRKWVKAFNERGIDGLVTRPRSGAPKKLRGQTAEQLAGELEKPQVAQRTFWTATAFHGHVKERYQLECSYATVVRFFHERGYALKVPQPWPDRQDQALRETFRQKLKSLTDRPDVDVWFGDETGVEGQPKSRRRWALKGTKPRSVKNGDHLRLNILGAVCPRTGEFFAIEASHSDSEVFQAFLDETAKTIQPTRKRNILILDNASWHKKTTLRWHFFEPLYLPPYSPDLNPIERLWLVMKANWFNNINCKNLDQLISRADQALLDLMDHPAQVAKTTTLSGTNF